ncbi:hypothetical protein [Actinomadura livida]|uniref:Peptidoglycan/LPS O-acetylase OafA/YrhL n=1 Tax=Actinomadura livida TaxID=79909 RepID=A0A7W7IE53_9ACTN|nr:MULTISPECIES: hypothetical protein [Actinomadura]MBB4775259.1 peptidoglycan/LPS O-acetylase OafA/YrhL [Actinomadura catellatispora]GGT89016.1 hypothetical protein GCM10010208_09730 [Actinomadura livida]
MPAPAVHGEAAPWAPGRVGPARALLRLAGALAVMAGVAALASTGGDPAPYWPRLAWALGLGAVTAVALIRPARRDRRGWQATVLAAPAVLAAVLVKFAVTGAPVAWVPAAAVVWTAVTLAPRAVRAWRRTPDWARSQRAGPST